MNGAFKSVLLRVFGRGSEVMPTGRPPDRQQLWDGEESSKGDWVVKPNTWPRPLLRGPAAPTELLVSRRWGVSRQARLRSDRVNVLARSCGGGRRDRDRRTRRDGARRHRWRGRRHDR